MSALPPPPSPSDISAGIQDGVLGIAIGVTSWLIRYACSTEKHSLGYIARRTATAGLVSLLVGSAVRGYMNSESIAFAAAGAAGYAAPELADGLLILVKKYVGKGKVSSKD